mgnify:CR=1 FL=1
MEKNQSLAFKLALFTVFLWSTVATAFKIALQSASVSQLVLVSSLTSLLVLVFIYVYQSKSNTQSLLNVFKQSPWRFIAAGLINPVIYYLVLFAAYERLPAQIAQPINYTWAIVLSLLAVPILKQKFTKGDAIGLFFCYLGVFILVTRFDFAQFSEINLLGVFFAVLSTLLWASYWMINAKISAPPVTALLLCFICAIPSLIVIALFNWSSFEFNINNVAAAIYIGLFEMSLAFVFWLKAMRLSTSTAQISILIYLSPFLSLVFIYFILGEPIYLTTVIGLIVICVGLLAQKQLNQKKYG